MTAGGTDKADVVASMFDNVLVHADNAASPPAAARQALSTVEGKAAAESAATKKRRC